VAAGSVVRRLPRAVEEAPVLFGLSVHDLIVGIPGLLLAIVLHEVAHGLVSTWLGDPTPALQGRLSLNPLAHIDWIGMVMLWLFRFGWARPVQIDPRYYRNQRLGMVLVALAGPAMNVLVAFVALLLLVHVAWPPDPWAQSVGDMLKLAVAYNVSFAVFNILPLPPLDGSRVLASLSHEGARLMAALEPYAWVVLVLLVVTGLINGVLVPMYQWLLAVLGAAAGL
jgi:Zn-dependent protease